MRREGKEIGGGKERREGEREGDKGKEEGEMEKARLERKAAGQVVDR